MRNGRETFSGLCASTVAALNTVKIKPSFQPQWIHQDWSRKSLRCSFIWSSAEHGRHVSHSPSY